MGKRLLQKKKKEKVTRVESPKVIKLAELSEQNETQNKTQSKIKNFFVYRIRLSSQNQTNLFGMCTKKKLEVSETPITLTRILVGIFPRHKALRIVRYIKKKAPYLDPWMMRCDGKYKVFAGSYEEKENIELAVSSLKKLGFKPRLENVVLGKERHFSLVCEVVEDKVSALEKTAKEAHLSFQRLRDSAFLKKSQGSVSTSNASR